MLRWIAQVAEFNSTMQLAGFAQIIHNQPFYSFQAGSQAKSLEIIRSAPVVSLRNTNTCIPKANFSGDVIHPQLWESGSGYETR